MFFFTPSFSAVWVSCSPLYALALRSFFFFRPSPSLDMNGRGGAGSKKVCTIGCYILSIFGLTFSHLSLPLAIPSPDLGGRAKKVCVMVFMPSILYV
jgi:hypothetical protein